MYSQVRHALRELLAVSVGKRKADHDNASCKLVGKINSLREFCTHNGKKDSTFGRLGLSQVNNRLDMWLHIPWVVCSLLRTAGGPTPPGERAEAQKRPDKVSIYT